ncbi:site-2 protease family protein [Candidatus Roizmanbacteria bacterium]|nr:site-2 protease family protein [Candidatus Roizmanbacteria bacterium]
MINILFSNPLLFVVYIAALLVAIAVHEFSHAFVADYLGDPTPRLQGRLKLNPLVHIDKFGLIFLLFFGFGWGKPVQFDPYNLKNPRRDAALISIAGPVSNFIIALLLSLVLRSFILLNQSFLYTISSFVIIPFISLNVILGVFNLLPIHPLDGFKIVGGILPEAKSKEWYQLERYGMIFLIMLIFPLGRSSMLDVIIRPAVSFLLQLFIPTQIPGVI